MYKFYSKRTVFWFIAILIILLTFLAGIEVAFFVRQSIFKKEVVNQNVIDFQTAGLFIEDRDAGYILKPGASTSDLPEWDSKKELYDKRYHGLGKHISTNAAGYRGLLYTIEKPIDTIRILTVGGSTTWGCFNDDGTTWPEYLERFLQNSVKNKKIQVINGAVGGYSSAQDLALVTKKYQFYKPDILLIASWTNDMYIQGRREYSVFPSPQSDYYVNKSAVNKNKFVYPFKGGRILYNHISDLMRFLRWRFSTPIGYASNPTKSFFKKYYSTNKVWINNNLNNVNGMISAVTRQVPDAEIYIIAMPTFFVPTDPEKYEEILNLPDHDIPMYHRSYLAKRVDSRFLFTMYDHHTILFQEILQNKSKEMGFELILGYSPFGKIEINERNKYFTDEIHLTAEGNRLLADEITRQLFKSSKKLFMQ